MGPSARAIAEQASFHALLHCYLREVTPGVWHRPGDWTGDPAGDYRGTAVCELELASQGLRLAVDVLYRSLAGRHRFGRIRCRCDGAAEWRDLNPWHLGFLLVREMYSQDHGMAPEVTRTREQELTYRLADSTQVMTRYIAARCGDPSLVSDRFIDTEQSLLFGHAAHPTPKSRQGLADWQHATYAPELAGRFQLQVFRVNPALVREGSSTGTPAAELLRQILALPDGGERPDPLVPVPVHPLQAQWLLAQPAVQAAIAAGSIQAPAPAGPAFTATASVRTLYSDDCDWMLKFSIPVRITNSLRINKAHELPAGVVMSHLWRRLDFQDRYPAFRILQDPAFVTVTLPGLAESGFEVIVRENPFRSGRDRGICSIAALTQDPLAGNPSRLRALIEGLALNEGRSLAAVSRDWYRQYLNCAIEPLLRLYDDHGIALEAHQQNSLLDLAAGYPGRYFYRDNQGYYLSESYRGQLLALVPELAATPELFYRDAMIRDRFCYYLIVNQLFSVIARFGQDQLIAESTLLDLTGHFLRALLPRLHGSAVALVQMLLEDQRLPYKGNLLTRLHDVDELNAELELAVYTSITNPLRRRTQAHAASSGSRLHDVA